MSNKSKHVKPGAIYFAVTNDQVRVLRMVQQDEAVRDRSRPGTALQVRPRADTPYLERTLYILFKRRFVTADDAKWKLTTLGSAVLDLLEADDLIAGRSTAGVTRSPTKKTATTKPTKKRAIKK